MAKLLLLQKTLLLLLLLSSIRKCFVTVGRWIITASSSLLSDDERRRRLRPKRSVAKFAAYCTCVGEVVDVSLLVEPRSLAMTAIIAVDSLKLLLDRYVGVVAWPLSSGSGKDLSTMWDHSRGSRQRKR